MASTYAAADAASADVTASVSVSVSADAAAGKCQIVAVSAALGAASKYSESKPWTNSVNVRLWFVYLLIRILPMNG